MEGGSGGSPAATATCRMLRSPSHESVTTDLSLFSVSSLATSDAAARPASQSLVRFKPSDLVRGPSPNPDKSLTPARPPDIPEIHWFEEENDLIRSCAALSSALGLQKSFSTSDISQLPAANSNAAPVANAIPVAGATLGRSWAVSELALSTVQRCSFLSDHPRLEHASRSCSTWVAVGDVASTSQLPSPHGGHSTSGAASATASAATSTAASATANSLPPPQPPAPSFTPADLIRSVNKKVRQNYIRRRLMTTYKALERLSQSEFNLDRLEVAAAAAAVPQPQGVQVHLRVPGAAAPPTAAVAAATLLRVVATNTNNLPLTITDVERERGKPLSKYDRNMMIFNWLHTLDNSSFEGIQWE
ncbi:uncharacterized protein LOC111056475 [Nilaparvata lugens]|uniref:uncharacterized protein LOC111056475 n=1 Tax=Nilaparvata lugens TaxID=108931 RepID=UPI00193D9B42|nr:uncharacterized protein LOC111056475 [Nilaparvata lugens]